MEKGKVSEFCDLSLIVSAIHRHARPAHAHSNPYISLTARPIRHSDADDYIKCDYCPITSHHIRVELLTPLRSKTYMFKSRIVCTRITYNRKFSQSDYP